MEYIVADVYTAVKQQSPHRLEQLLKANLSPDFIFNSARYEDVFGRNLLMVATADQNLDLVELLLKYSCHINWGVRKVLQPGTNLVSYISDKNFHDLESTSLYYAICTGKVDIVKLLIKGGANVNMMCAEKMSALSHAVDAEDIEITEAIIKVKNCNVNTQDMYGLSPLHIAVIHNRADIATMLLKRRAIVDIEQCQGGTPLFLSNEYTTLKILLEYGADPNHVRKNSHHSHEQLTPFSSVLKRCRDPLVIETLVLAGAVVTDDILQKSKAWILRENPMLHSWLEKQYQIPISLKINCSLVIRRCLSSASLGVGLGVHKRVDLLPIPNQIKDFVLMRHL